MEHLDSVERAEKGQLHLHLIRASKRLQQIRENLRAKVESNDPREAAHSGREQQPRKQSSSRHATQPRSHTPSSHSPQDRARKGPGYRKERTNRIQGKKRTCALSCAA